MAQYYQSKDVWSRTLSIHVYPIDELRSVLQKSIRRGCIEEAALAARDLAKLGDRLPTAILHEQAALEERLAG